MVPSYMELVREFGRIGRNDAEIAGGKGASLGEMTQAGIPVPPGYVILSDAFERFIEETNLNVEIDAILGSVNHEEMHTVEYASAKIQDLILRASMPEDIKKEAMDAFAKLGAEFVAVRSSATAEDGATAAWAGQLDTFLNTTEATLLENVQRCWASLFTPRAIFYRFEKQLDTDKISVAVVVQKMVNSDAAGIAFSVHPVTEDRNQLIIEAGFGLGEAVVSGQITPDSYVVTKSPREILDKNLSEQEQGLYRKEGGGNEWRPTPHGANQVLSDEQIFALSETLIGIEKHYGFPVDTEWAMEGSEIYITQSRPITTLTAPKEEGSDYRDYVFTKLGRWATMPADTETWHTPATSEEFEKRFGIYKEILALHVFENGEYYNEMYTPVSFVEKLHARIREIVAEDPKGMEKILMKFYEEREDVKRDVPTINPPDLGKLSDAELALVYKKNRSAVHAIVAYDQFTWLAESYWLPLMDRVLVEKHGLTKGSPEYTDALFALIKPHEISTTLEEKREVLKETLAIAAGTQEVDTAAKRLAKDFGWMPVLAYGVPWGTEKYVEALNETLAQNQEKLSKEYDALTRYSELRDQDFDAVAKQYSINETDLQPFIDFGLAIDARNEAEYMNSVCGFGLLALYDEIAKRFGMTVLELRKLSEREIIGALEGELDPKAAYAGKTRVIAWFVAPTRKRIDYLGAEGDELLEYLKTQAPGLITSSDSSRGITANRGKVEGRVRLVPTPEDNDRVQEGDILFAYSTMVDNLPAMKRAAAYVTESGGLTCHAAVVAREFGVPCVVSYKDAMSSFKDGDLVEVDADAGTVRLVGSAPPTFSDAPSVEKADGASDLVREYKLDDSSWVYKGFHGMLHTFFPVMETGPWMQDFFGDCAKRMLFFVKDDYVHWFWNAPELDRIRETFFTRLKENPDYLEELKKEWRVRITRFENVLKEMDETNLSALSDEELVSLYDELYEAYVYEFCCFMALGDAVSMRADEYLAPEFEKILGADFIQVFPKLVTTQYLSFVEEESLAREELVAEYKKIGSLNPKKLEEHADQFFYIQNNYAKGIHLTADDFATLVKEDAEKDIEPAEDTREERLRVKEELMDRYALSPWHRTLLYVADEFFKLQDTRKKYALISNYYQTQLLQEAERRTGISLALLRYSVYPEFRSVLAKTIDTAMLAERKKICFCTYVPDGFQIVAGAPAEAALGFLRGEGEKTKELKGMVASTGKVQGRVKKVLKIHDMVNMDQGDILVSSMTRPEMVPAMKLAGAIVTDEGGITSHAAIVSRELGIPCVIGTKIATQVLNDGDLVEVDAYEGVIRLLEEATKDSGTTFSPERIFGSPDAFASLGRWVSPVLENDMWLHWCDTPESRALGIPPDTNPGIISVDGYFLYRTQGAYAFIRDQILKELVEGKTSFAESIYATAASITRECDEAVARARREPSLELFAELRPLMRRLRLPWFSCFVISDAADEYLASYASKTDTSAEELGRLIPKLENPLLMDQKRLVAFKGRIEALGAGFDFDAIGKTNSKLAQELSVYQKETENIGTHHFWGEPRTMERFLEAVSYASSVEEEEPVGPADLAAFFDLASKAAKWRLECAERSSRLPYAFRPLLEETAKELGVEYEDLIYLTTEEILAAKRAGVVDKSLLAARKTGYAIFAEDDGTKVVSGEAVERIKEYFNLELPVSDTKEIKGSIGNKGKVTGRAAVILKPSDNERVKEGMILIVPETTPDFIPAMGRAAAFVTDRGGVTSHAAIVAREMNKPCVIGTKVATQALKDGDLVEVDADTGVVRMLERAGSVATVLTKLFSREKPLIYLRMWNDSDRMGYRDFLDHEVEHSVFIVLPPGQKGSVWYSADEFETVGVKLLAEKMKDSEFADRLTGRLDAHWPELKHYIEGSEKIDSMSALRHFYDHLVSWWSAMTVAFEVPNVPGVSAEMSQKILAYREEGEKHTETCNRLMVTFLQNAFPELGGLIYFMTPEEAEIYATDPDSVRQRLESRRDGCALVDEEAYPIEELDTALARRSLVLQKTGLVQAKEFRGTTAFAGRVQGTVRIVHSNSDLKKVKSGEILVTEMTNPDYVPAMKIAGAVITDEGGMTCHAAIASRELKVPCIVGTKIATQVLKDGDRVEVDATTGIIRIL